MARLCQILAKNPQADADQNYTNNAFIRNAQILIHYFYLMTSSKAMVSIVILALACLAASQHFNLNMATGSFRQEKKKTSSPEQGLHSVVQSENITQAESRSETKSASESAEIESVQDSSSAQTETKNTTKSIKTDLTLQLIIEKLIDSNDLQGFTIQSVMKYTSNGVYRIVFADSKGNQKHFAATIQDDGSLWASQFEYRSTESSSTSTKDQTIIERTGEQIGNYDDVKLIKNHLLSNYDLTGFWIQSVEFYAQQKTYEVIYSNSSGVDQTFMVQLGPDRQVIVNQHFVQQISDAKKEKRQQTEGKDKDDKPVKYTAEEISSNQNIQKIDRRLRNNLNLDSYTIFSAEFYAPNQIYRIVYSNSQGIHQNFVIQLPSNGEVIVVEHTIQKPKIEEDKSKQTPEQSDKPVKYTAEEISSNQNIQKIDRRLRNNLNLDSYTIFSAEFYAPNQIYRIVYSNSQGIHQNFVIQLPSNGEVIVVEHTIQKPKIEEDKSKQTPEQNGKPVKYTAEEISSNQNIQKIDRRLRNNLNLDSYTIFSAEFYAPNQIYRIVYSNSQGIHQNFVIQLPSNGEVIVVEHTIQKPKIEEDKSKQTPEQNGKPVKYTAEEISSNQNIQKIDRRLRNNLNLDSYTIFSAEFYAPNQIYRIVYSNSQGIHQNFVIQLPSDGKIIVVEHSVQKPKIEEDKSKQTPEQNGKPVKYTAEDVRSDPKFYFINQQLRDVSNLKGFTLMSVESLAQSNTFRFIYANRQRVSQTFILKLGSNEQIYISYHQVRQGSMYSSNEHIQGQPQGLLTDSQMKSDTRLKTIYQKLQTQFHLQDYIVESARVQLANGSKYTIVYSNRFRNTITFVVVLSFKGEISVEKKFRGPEDNHLTQTVKKAPEQITSDKNKSVINEQLQAKYSLEGFRISSATFDNSTNRYAFAYSEPDGTNQGFNGMLYSDGNISVDEHVVFRRFTAYQDETDMTLDEFIKFHKSSYEALIAMYIYIFGEDSEVISVFINSQQTVFRFVSRNKIITSFRYSNGEYLVIKIETLRQLISSRTPYALHRDQYPSFIELIGFQIDFPLEQISSISGQSQKEDLSDVRVHHLQILLKDGQSYSLELIQTSPKTIVVLNYYNNKRADLTFLQPTELSKDLSLYGLKPSSGQPMYVQQSENDSQIVRIVFITEGHDRRIQLIVDEQASIIKSYRVLDEGFVQWSHLLKAEPLLKQQFYQKISQPNREHLPGVMNAFKKSVMVKKIDHLYDFDVVYENKYSAYRVKVMMINGVRIVYQYKPLYEDLRTPKYYYPFIKDQEEVEKAAVDHYTEFKTAQDFLFSETSHSPKQMQLIKLFYKKVGRQISFKVFYTNNNQIIYAYLVYQIGSKKTKIQNLVEIKPSHMKLKQCAKMSPSHDQCLECQQGYQAAMNGQCYAKVEHCSVSSATYCLACETSYVLNKVKNICQIS